MLDCKQSKIWNLVTQMDSQPVSLASVAAKKAVDKPNISLSALSTMITSWDGITVGIMAVWMCPISDHPNERGSNQNLLHKMKIKIGILLSEAQTQNTVSIFLVGIFIQTNNGVHTSHIFGLDDNLKCLVIESIFVPLNSTPQKNLSCLHFPGHLLIFGTLTKKSSSSS